MVGRYVVPLQLWVRLCGKISHEPRSLGTMGRRSPSPTSDSWREGGHVEGRHGSDTGQQGHALRRMMDEVVAPMWWRWLKQMRW